MFKRILVAVDGSLTSNRGLKTAIELAKVHGAVLEAVHVIDDMAIAQGSAGFNGAGYVPAQYIDEWLKDLRKSGQRILEHAEKVAENRGYRLQTALVETLGQGVAHVVLKQARKLSADLIVMGTHGRRGLRRVLMGSDAEAVLRESRVPVLLVRSPLRQASSKTLRSSRRPRAIATAARKRPAVRAEH